MAAIDDINKDYQNAVGPKAVVANQNAGVESRVAGMLKNDSPLMKAARTDAAKTGNKRGLLNSTMTTQAGTRAALDVVVPIASQEAGQAHQVNLSSQGYQQEGMLQAPRLASQERLSERQEAGAKERLALEISSREGMSAADRAARSADLSKQLNSQEGLAGRELTSRETLAREGEAGTNNRAAAELTNRTNLSRDEIAANQTSAVRDAVAQANNSYSSAYNAIMSNPNISAQDRATYLESIESRRQADLILIEGLYNVDLNWGPAPSAPGGGGGGGGAPGAPYTPNWENPGT